MIKCDVGYVKQHSEQHVRIPHYDITKIEGYDYFPGTALMLAIKYHHIVLLEYLLPEIKYTT